MRKAAKWPRAANSTWSRSADLLARAPLRRNLTAKWAAERTWQSSLWFMLKCCSSLGTVRSKIIDASYSHVRGFCRYCYIRILLLPLKCKCCKEEMPIIHAQCIFIVWVLLHRSFICYSCIIWMQGCFSMHLQNPVNTLAEWWARLASLGTIPRYRESGRK